MLVVNTDKNSNREWNSYLSNDPYGPVPIIPEKTIVRANVFRNGRVDVSRSGHRKEFFVRLVASVGQRKTSESP